MFKEIIKFTIFKWAGSKTDHNTNVILTEKELIIFGDKIVSDIYQNSYLSLEIKLPNIKVLEDDVYRRMHRINLEDIENIQLTPGGIIRSSKLIITLNNKGRYILKDSDKQYQSQFKTVYDYITDFLQNKTEHLSRIKKIENDYCEKEQQRIRLEQERKTQKENEYYLMFKGFTKIGISKIIRTETCNDCNEVQIYIKENILLFEKSYSILKKDYIEGKVDDLNKYLLYLDLNIIDCAYFILGDYFNKAAYELSTKWNQYQNEYNTYVTSSNIQSSLKDFSTSPKIDVGGFIIGGLIGGTAGAILGGIVDQTSSKNIYTSPVQTNVVIPQQYILKDYPQFVIRYRLNKEYKHIILDNKNTSINKEQLLDLFGNKLVDSQTGENFYILLSNNNNQQSTQIDNPYDELKKLKELFDLGIITEEEFQFKKKQLLNL